MSVPRVRFRVAIVDGVAAVEKRTIVKRMVRIFATREAVYEPSRPWTSKAWPDAGSAGDAVAAALDSAQRSTLAERANVERLRAGLTAAQATYEKSLADLQAIEALGMRGAK